MTLQAPDDGTDAGIASIALSFQAGAGLGLNANPDDVAALAGLPRHRRPRPPVFPFTPQPYILAGTAVGSCVVLSLFSPQSGWVVDLTSITVSGFTAGAIAITKGAPAVTAAGAPAAIEYVGSFTAAGIFPYPQHGMPLLDANDVLYATVMAALTAPNGAVITATGIMVPVSRMDEYLS